MQLYLIVMEIMQLIHNRIYVIREQRIMLDRDIAALYEVETRVFNQAVKRNFQRFPSDFMFQLTREEWDAIKLRMIPTEGDMSSQIVMTYPKKRPNVALPNAFTEQGVAMLSGILHSDKAIQMNIAIMRAFVEIRRLMVKEPNVWEQLTQLKKGWENTIYN